MADTDTIRFTCRRPDCGYMNVWTRAEVLRKGKKTIFMGTAPATRIYVVPCKNPQAPACPELRRIEVVDHEGDAA